MQKRKWILRGIWLVPPVIAWVFWEVVKDAVAGWINKQLQKQWEMIDPAIQDNLLFTWLPPIALMAVIGVALWFVYRLGAQPVTTSNVSVSLVGTLLNDKETVKPIILAELETTVSKIGDFTPACAIRVTNTGPELEGKCLVQIENHGLNIHMPDPLVIRTEGQIRGKPTGRFTLSTGQPTLVPILFREPAQINQFRFIGGDGKHYLFAGDSAEFVVAIYGAATPTRVRIRLSVGRDWKINSEMEYC